MVQRINRTLTVCTAEAFNNDFKITQQATLPLKLKPVITISFNLAIDRKKITIVTFSLYN